jgi:hypothetical protein
MFDLGHHKIPNLKRTNRVIIMFDCHGLVKSLLKASTIFCDAK